MANAALPLTISTPDGSGQAVHPDVVWVPGGLWGASHWMACTPYPGGYDRLENPIIRISDDGVSWRPVEGGPDPIVGPPASDDEHNADPDLVLADEHLHLFYMTTNKRHRHTRFSVTTTEDGRTWTPPEVIHEATWGVSPALVERAGEWSMWYVELNTSRGFGPSQVWRRLGRSPTTLSEPLRCAMEIPGYVPWHVDVQMVGLAYEALVAAFPHGTDTSHTRLFHTISDDGVHFEGFRLILEPSFLGWDDRHIYRSTFTVKPDGSYRIWYTGGSWNRRYGIGLVEGPLDDLRPVQPGSPTLGDRLGWAADAVVGVTKHRIRPFVPRSVMEWRSRRGRPPTPSH